jgi:hypothetical protein
VGTFFSSFFGDSRTQANTGRNRFTEISGSAIPQWPDQYFSGRDKSDKTADFPV